MVDMTGFHLRSRYAPVRALLRHRQSGVGKCVAVAGTGAAAHMVIRMAHAMGAEVSVLAPVITQTDRLWLGADHYFSTTDAMMRRALEGAFDLIVCTEAGYDLKNSIDLLKFEGAMLMAEAPVTPVSADFLHDALAFCGCPVD